MDRICLAILTPMQSAAGGAFQTELEKIPIVRMNQNCMTSTKYIQWENVHIIRVSIVEIRRLRSWIKFCFSFVLNIIIYAAI